MDAGMWSMLCCAETGPRGPSFQGVLSHPFPHRQVHLHPRTDCHLLRKHQPDLLSLRRRHSQRPLTPWACLLFQQQCKRESKING
ncbi:unnamed protein product [Gulo gulo]|uniref:Uncharacterized protein n=1 Tax=Gulo gulo TaxID=48420 RepID=A0A9X9LCC8_GULGU|nr:unnamed protein product [Gulo gulo]